MRNIICLAGQPLEAALLQRFEGSPYGFDPRSSDFGKFTAISDAENLIVPLFQSIPDSFEAAAEEAFVVVEAARGFKAASGRWPRRMVVLLPDIADSASKAGLAMAETHVAYVASALMAASFAPNALRYEPTDGGRLLAANAAFALVSGLADEVRGQVLPIREGRR